MSTPSVPVLPPLDYSLLFPDLINFHMQNNAHQPMYVYPNDQSPLGVTEISFLEFGRAAHRIAHVLRPGRTGDDGQVVMLIASNDSIHYHAVLTGASIAGMVPFLVSPRNSAPAIVHMMKKTGCSRFITLHHAHQGLIDEIRKELAGDELIVDEMPTMAYAFPKLGIETEADAFEPYPAPLVRPDLGQTVLYIHSSGSTGFPKPCPFSHKFLIQLMAQPFCRAFKRITSDRLGCMAPPTFHLFGVVAQLFLPVAYLVQAAVFPPRAVTDPKAAAVIPTSDNVLDCVRTTKCKIVVSVPTFLEHWSQSQDAVEELKKLDLLIFGGGPLAESVGNRLFTAGVRLGTAYGGTEFGCPTVFPSEQDIKDGDWMWLRFRDDAEIRWASQGDDSYELQILSTENYEPCVENLPDVRGYATADLFVKHPTKDLWKIIGRADDVITLASGEKTVPIPMEGIIGASPLLQGAVMFGRQRNQVGLLVAPSPEHVVDVKDDNAVAEFRNKIWPLVEEANKIAPAFSRIFKEMILIATPEKPILRTPKGTIQKKLTLKLYEAEIDALYDAVEATYESNGLSGPSNWTVDIVEGWLMEHACAITKGHDIDPNADLFAQGFDSLSVTYLRNQIINALRKSPDATVRSAVSRIPLNIVFECPTITLLASRIANIVGEDAASPSLDFVQQHVAAMNAMIEKYSTGFGGSTNGYAVNGTMTNGTARAPEVVLLTGSTGGLGSFLLAQLIENLAVARVYAFNRPSKLSLEERQKSAFIDRGLSVDLMASEKLVLVEADASQENCGLSSDMYEQIRGSLTAIIHNAWRLDFNLSLASFEPNVKATRNLIDLALNSHHRHSFRFVFTSSVGTAQGWDNSKGPFPEEIQPDPSSAAGNGYGESKYVCDRIIINSGLSATSLRIGQIAGGPNGYWATTDWVPIFVKSSLALGALPQSPGVLSWMRAEEVAAASLDIAFSKKAPQALNIVNPRRAPWNDIMSSIRDECKQQKLPGSEDLSLIPFLDWVGRLEKKAEGATSEDLINIPAIKLLAFFRAMAQGDAAHQEGPSVRETGAFNEFSTAKAELASKTMAEMRPVGDVEARSWVKYWHSKGLF